MNRNFLQRLTEERLLDARALLAGERWAFAYYTVGYAVECALKSCVLTQMVYTGAVFRGKDEKVAPERYFTHDYAKLVDLAGLSGTLKQACGQNPRLMDFWNVARGWDETSRYKSVPRESAERLYAAITQEQDGVLRWIRLHW